MRLFIYIAIYNRIKKRLAKNDAGSDTTEIAIICQKTYLGKLILNSKVAISNMIFNSSFKKVDVNYKIFRKFTPVSCAVIINRDVVLSVK